MSMPEDETRSGSMEESAEEMISPALKELLKDMTEKYQKPVFEKESGLVFPREVIEQFNGGRFCVQCSSCHGCR